MISKPLSMENALARTGAGTTRQRSSSIRALVGLLVVLVVGFAKGPSFCRVCYADLFLPDWSYTSINKVLCILTVFNGLQLVWYSSHLSSKLSVDILRSNCRHRSSEVLSWAIEPMSAVLPPICLSSWVRGVVERNAEYVHET